ncbi:MAG: bifunctional alpha,alpha-trehalose-phosphate synthase (UDP-forming)/trehalose-phosphatase [Syntrophales bacterium]
MSSERLKAFIEERFSKGALIVVSNREPYIHKKTGLGIKIERPAGGLVSAIDDVLKATGGIWVAWGSGSLDKDVVDDRNSIMVPPGNPSYSLKRVWLSPGEIDNYYNGYSNQVLWPLCHITLDRVYFRKKFWRDYEKVNQSFADAVLEEAEEDSIIWIHDYHLCLVPKMLREKETKLTVAHFWHIPWPDWGVFRVCPQSKEILEGLLGNDLIGFQIPLFVKNFSDCVRECLSADVNYKNSTVTYREHTTRLKAFPISIDYDKFDSMASSPRTIKIMKNIKKRYGIAQDYIGLGVDRLEYTKALIKRLQAINLFFERYQRFREIFTFIQIAVPTRTEEPYLSYKKAVEELISKINEKYSLPGWKPIIYIDTKVEHKDLVAYYRLADVAIISSIYDGMNLVAKEYIASQVEETGGLILSEFAGAADQLDGAILVNPYDIEEFSNSIQRSLTMPRREKTSRIATLRRHVKENDIYKWVYDILREIVTISNIKNKNMSYLFDHTSELKEKISTSIFLFLDYDGTLTPIVELPDQAFIPDDIRSLILRLKEYIPVAVVSGRSLQDIKTKVGIEGIVYVGNHGAEIWDGKKAIINKESKVENRILKQLLNRLKEALLHIQGVIIEDKHFTVSIHFRMVKVKYLGELFDKFWDIAKDFESSFKITSGKKVFELRPLNAWDKGNAVSWIIKNMGSGRIPLYLGDDITDEDAFRALKGIGMSISIGVCSEADYYLKNQQEIKKFLQQLLKFEEAG